MGTKVFVSALTDADPQARMLANNKDVREKLRNLIGEWKNILPPSLINKLIMVD